MNRQEAYEKMLWNSLPDVVRTRIEDAVGRSSELVRIDKNIATETVIRTLNKLNFYTKWSLLHDKLEVRWN